MAHARRCSLLVLQDEPHFFDGEFYYSEQNYGYFVNWVANHLSRTTLAVPTTTHNARFGHKLTLPHVGFHQLPYWRSTLSYLKLRRREKRNFRQQARALVADHDVVMVRLPSLPARCFAIEARRQGKALVTYLAGHVLTGANALQSPNPLIRLAAYGMARHVHRVMMRIVSDSDVAFAMGKELHDLCASRNTNSRQLITSLVSEKELLVREDTLPSDGPVVLFRAARIYPNKGTEHLLDAVHLLVTRGYDLRVKLAGGGNDPAYVEGLKARCASRGIADRIEWLGHVDFGPDVFRLYHQAHIGVLSSLSEGFPRFINEAWSFSLPVVATDLPGLCPPVVPDENAVLVPPASSVALADGIARVIDNQDLRRRIIQGGHAVARDNTAEAQSLRVAEMIHQATLDRGKHAIAH